ncbi:MAG: MraY family glycosyltransferase [Microscillaceae bacterium]|nr:MraY family glycosyltransferase [Microscillaceae bacterium]
MDLNYFALTAITAFVITYLSIPSLIKVAQEKHLYDEPNEKRKSHKNSIPTLGGVAIFGGSFISATLFVNFEKLPEFAYALPAFVLLFFTGVKDDIIPLTPRKKLLAQILASLIIVLKCDIRLTHFYGFLGMDEISYIFSVIISIFTLLVIINSFNLIDGINGLAGGIGLIVSITFSYLFYELGQFELMILALALAGSLGAFLCYNLAVEAKIFMGDTGSLLIGLFLAMFSLEFIEINRMTGNLFEVTFAPVFVFTMLIIPLFDTLRVFIIRIVQRKSPFKGDRNHLHHFLLDLGMAHWQASILLYIVSIAFIILALLIQDAPRIWSLTIILVSAILMSTLLAHLRSEHKKRQHILLISIKPKPIPAVNSRHVNPQKKIKVETAGKYLESEQV